MKLAEALAQRADMIRMIGELRGRLQRSAVTTEGDSPPEYTGTLLDSLAVVSSDLEHIIAQINRTNTATEIAPGVTITDALARRDAINQQLPVLQFLIAHTANAMNQHRAMRSELRTVSHVDIRAVQADIDTLSAELRRLDNAIQERNWLTELLE